jgi:hypothetical protein
MSGVLFALLVARVHPVSTPVLSVDPDLGFFRRSIHWDFSPVMSFKDAGFEMSSSRPSDFGDRGTAVVTFMEGRFRGGLLKDSTRGGQN